VDAYTLKKSKHTGELHLFRGVMTPNETEHQCTSDSLSICKKMKKGDSEKNIFACETEQAAREKCAALGRQVCGICVSDLYATF
jgi:hypothetical protein